VSTEEKNKQEKNRPDFQKNIYFPQNKKVKQPKKLKL